MAVVDRSFLTDGTGQSIAEGLASVAQAIENSGGGGGASEPLIVTATSDAEGNVTSDIYLEEIKEAISQNRPVYLNWVNHPDSEYIISSLNYIPMSNVVPPSLDYAGAVDFAFHIIGDGDVTFMMVSVRDNYVQMYQQRLTSY